MQVESVAEQLLFSTLRIQTQTGLGTGAIVNYESAGQVFPFLVTNHHVIANTSAGRVTFTLADNSTTPSQPLLGQPHSVNLSNGGWRWVRHPSEKIDIAVLPLGPVINYIKERGVEVFYRGIPVSMVPDEQKLLELDAVEEILFVGYPSGVIDSVNNLPVFRKGITSSPITVDFEGQPVFLIDASVFRGSSGSPVLVYNKGSWVTKAGKIQTGHRTLFLGILGRGYYRTDDNTLAVREVPTALEQVVKTEQMIDLGVVFKSKAVVEVIESQLRVWGKLPLESAETEAAS